MLCKKSKRPFILVGIAAVLIAAIAVVLCLVINGINPVANTLLAVGRLRDMTGANITVRTEGNNAATNEIVIAFDFGSDLKDSALDIEFNRLPTDTMIHMAALDGNLGIEAGGEYIYFSGYTSILESILNNGIKAKLGVDPGIDANKLIKDSKINGEYILELAKDLSGADYDEETIRGIKKLFADFVARECSKKSVWNKFIYGYKGSAGSCEYTVDPAELGLVFIDYLDKCGDSRNSEVKKAAELILDRLQDVSGAKSALEKNRGDFAAFVSYTTKGGRLAELEIKAGNTKTELAIDSFNKPEINREELREFMDEVQDSSVDYSRYW